MKNKWSKRAPICLLIIIFLIYIPYSEAGDADRNFTTPQQGWDLTMDELVTLSASSDQAVIEGTPTFDGFKNYIIQEDITISQTDRLVVSPYDRLIFKKNNSGNPTGITVSGSLTINGLPSGSSRSPRP